MAAFAPARALYRSVGFTPCGPFASYVPSRHSAWMTLELDGSGPRRPNEGRVAVRRWVLVHMIEEYAQHNGHADLLHVRVDGAIGQ